MPQNCARVSLEGTCGVDWTRLGAQCSVRLFGHAGRDCVCVCIEEVGVNHLVSGDFRERRVEVMMMRCVQGAASVPGGRAHFARCLAAESIAQEH